MKKLILILLILLAVLPIFSSPSRESIENFIGVVAFRTNDPFIEEVITEIKRQAIGKLPVHIFYSEDSQILQNKQVDEMLTSGRCKAIILNTVDRTSAGLLIQKAKKYNVPIVFFNREPLKDDMAIWDKVYYVGAKAEESGIMAGEIVVSLWNSNKLADKNGDGVLQFVVIRGESGHQDSELRTEYAINTIIDSGITVERLAEVAANWRRDLAEETMEDFLTNFGSSIEVVLANNDAMALGAIDALLKAGYTSDNFIPVVGVDGTKEAMVALEEGTLYGTVRNDSINQARAAYNIAFNLAFGLDVSEDSVGYKIVDNQYVWIPYQRVMY